MIELLDTAGHILVGGHRGCACAAPENSIAAMQQALAWGADYLEIDIQLTKDNVAVVYHDVRLEQKTPLCGYVHEYDYAQIKRAVPSLCTLEEALQWGGEANAHFGLELKTVPLDMQPYNLRLVDILSDLLERTDMQKKVFAFGMDYQVLNRLRAENSHVALGLIAPFVPQDPVQLMRETGAVIYLSYIYNMTPDDIRQLHGAGYYVSGSILREDRWVEKAVELGVDLFDTDFPGKYARSH